jgi:ribosomal-protein-alanine N-acetyltransferase
MKIREMTLVDIDTVMPIENAAHTHPWSRNLIEKSVAGKHECWVLECEGLIVGHGIISAAGGQADLLTIAIDPAQQGKGLGRQLLEHIELRAEALGADTLFLEVRESNTAAIKLYETAGFNELGRRNNYYPAANGGKEDALKMALPLSM